MKAVKQTAKKCKQQFVLNLKYCISSRTGSWQRYNGIVFYNAINGEWNSRGFEVIHDNRLN